MAPHDAPAPKPPPFARPNLKTLSAVVLLCFASSLLALQAPPPAKYLPFALLLLILCALTARRLKAARLRVSGRKGEAVRWHIGGERLNREMATLVRGNGRNLRKGVVFYGNGDVYEGGFCEGRCSGSGVYSFAGKGKYEGDWIDGKYDGYGVESWARGSWYRGQFRQGVRQGFGVYRFYNGDCYAGEWLRGQSHGRGAQNCSDGSSYFGEFKFGVKHGIGRYRFR